MMRPTDTFLISYPKTGRTWVGFFLATLIADSADTLTLKNFQCLVPTIAIDAQESIWCDVDRLPSPRVFLSHAASGYRELPRVIYLVRDPRDTMVSYYHHHTRTEPDFRLSMRDFVCRNEMFPGDWGEHVTEWLSHYERQKMLVVRYEDLLPDSRWWFRAIVDFCGIEATDDEVVRALKCASFSNMQDLERKFGTVDAGCEPGFVRRGKVGSWKDELAPGLVSVIEQRYGKLMRMLGYL